LIGRAPFGQNSDVDGTSVRIAIITPQPVVAAGLRTLLEQCEHPSQVVTLHANGPDPDVVLYDVIGLLSGDGTDLDIVVGKTASAVLAISRELRPDLLAQALQRGADGFFPLGATEPEICAAILSTQTGWKVGDTGENPVVGSSASAAFADRVGSDQGLTSREREVLALIAQGYSNVEIAGEIHLGINTIKTHIRGAYRKIGATNRSEAVAWAIRHGLPSQFR
jgi:DNA-binding NarL/FixJ family response regulator